MLTLLAALLIPVPGPTPAPPAGPYADGHALLRAMHDRYATTWYQTLTFVQTTTNYRANTVETWYEAARIPGSLRIDIAPLDSGKALLFQHDSIYQFADGKLAQQAPLVHPLMVLGFDVYRDPVEKTVAKLQGIGFDLSSIREDTWQGRKVFVVGAAAGDSTTRQFWIDQERLVFVRSLETGRGGAWVETQFNKYEPLGGGWIAVEVLFSVNGKAATKEEYRDVRQGMPLPDALFDPAAFARPAWVTP